MMQLQSFHHQELSVEFLPVCVNLSRVCAERALLLHSAVDQWNAMDDNI